MEQISRWNENEFDSDDSIESDDEALEIYLNEQRLAAMEHVDCGDDLDDDPELELRFRLEVMEGDLRRMNIEFETDDDRIWILGKSRIIFRNRHHVGLFLGIRLDKMSCLWSKERSKWYFKPELPLYPSYGYTFRTSEAQSAFQKEEKSKLKKMRRRQNIHAYFWHIKHIVW